MRRFGRARIDAIAMKTVGHLSAGASRWRMQRGFSLVEVVIAMAIVGVSAFALLSGISSGMLTMQMARENVRATQIMVERTETLRLYSWDQLNTTNFIQTAFTESYDPVSTNGGAGP
jgi:prepilin-type N-terminal cleavage/methylation domain-containing protein